MSMVVAEEQGVSLMEARHLEFELERSSRWPFDGSIRGLLAKAVTVNRTLHDALRWKKGREIKKRPG